MLSYDAAFFVLINEELSCFLFFHLFSTSIFTVCHHFFVLCCVSITGFIPIGKSHCFKRKITFIWLSYYWCRTPVLPLTYYAPSRSQITEWPRSYVVIAIYIGHHNSGCDYRCWSCEAKPGETRTSNRFSDTLLHKFISGFIFWFLYKWIHCAHHGT